jgi:hypothetical protein
VRCLVAFFLFGVPDRVEVVVVQGIAFDGTFTATPRDVALCAADCARVLDGVGSFFVNDLIVNDPHR